MIPQADVEKIRRGTYTLERIREIERVNDHDMGAFVRAFEESLGPEGRFVHMGLTSSDVVDTGLALQLRDAWTSCCRRRGPWTAVLERQALAYKDTPQMGRSHGVHAEPITFGFKLLLWVEEMRATCSAWSGPGRRSPWARSPGPWAPTPTSPRRWRSTSAPPWGWPSTPSPARSCSATATPSCCAPWP